MQENILSSKFGCYTHNTLNLTTIVQPYFSLSARENIGHEQVDLTLYLQYINLGFWLVNKSDFFSFAPFTMKSLHPTGFPLFFLN